MCQNPGFCVLHIFSGEATPHHKLAAQWAEPVSLTFHSALRKLNTEPSIGASHQVSVHLARQLQRRRFLEINQSDKNDLWWPCLLTDGN